MHTTDIFFLPVTFFPPPFVGIIIIVFPLSLNVSRRINRETSQLLLVCFNFINILNILCKYCFYTSDIGKLLVVILLLFLV